MGVWEDLEDFLSFVGKVALVGAGIAIGVAAVQAALYTAAAVKTIGAVGCLASIETGKSALGAVVTAALAYTSCQTISSGVQLRKAGSKGYE